MRSILIYYPADSLLPKHAERYEVRVSAGDDLPKWLNQTELDSVYTVHAGVSRGDMLERAIYRAKHIDDHGKLNHVRAAIAVTGADGD